MAEALLRRRAEAASLDLTVRSAGSLFELRAPESGAVAALQKLGIDLGSHRSHIFDGEAIRRADLVIGMELRHVREICLIEPAAFRSTFTLPDLVLRAEAIGVRTDEPFDDWVARLGADRTPSDVLATRLDLEVADPMGASHRAFRRCAAEIDDLLARFVALAWPGDPRRGHDDLVRHPTPRSL
jgi:protein-tyrosine-phosphatase